MSGVRSRRREPAGKTSSSEVESAGRTILNVVRAAEASREGAAAETAAHHADADEEDETTMEGAGAVPVSTPESADSTRVWRHTMWRTHRTELCVRHAYKGARTPRKSQLVGS